MVHSNVFLNFATTAMKIPHYFDKAEDVTLKSAQMVYSWSLLFAGTDNSFNLPLNRLHLYRRPGTGATGALFYSKDRL